MKKIIFIVGLLAMGCNKIEPIEVVTPQRDIDTEVLKKYKSQLETRNVVMGMLYNWGKESGALLRNTPDSLDIVVVKQGYNNLSELLKEDLKVAQDKKATKVLIGVDFEAVYNKYQENKEADFENQKTEKEKEWIASNERLTEDEKNKIISSIEKNVQEKHSKVAIENLKKQASEVSQIIKNGGFNGVSIEFPQNFNEVYNVENFNKFLEEIIKFAGKGKERLLVIENPYLAGKTFIENANWVVYRQKEQQLLANFTKQSSLWENNRYIPSVDFSEEDLADGFSDSPIFIQGGRLPRTIDVINWNAANKGGVAYYHIEKNYYNIEGNVPFKTLRNIIGKIQLQK